ncbi:type II secretion system protein N [Cellvibrio sp. pealriver]|uniref:type II secretion system protein N n=1 Tax=Cellvibrio sp. pealriver TaxID=1622269 RepID=UPI00066FC7E9|nr:type II secretion system protein N [Cellvibrio sp. pealriver]
MNPIPALLKTHKKLWISLGVSLFLIFVISSIPAVWGAYLLSRSSGLALSGVTGTIWNGRASLASLPRPEREYSLGQLSWSLSPLSLLTLSPCAHVKTNLPGQQFEGDVCGGAGGAVKLRNADISLPVALVQTKLPIPVQGQFSAHIEEMELRGNVLLKLKGKLTWNGARVNTGVNWLDIGSYAAEFTDNGSNGISAKLFHLAGPVDVDLQVELAAPSGGKVTGELAAPRAFFEAANAMDMLAMFAQEDRVDDEGKTHYRVDMNL